MPEYSAIGTSVTQANKEDQRQAGQQDVQRDFVGRLLPLGPFHQSNHAIQEGLARARGDAHDDAIGQDFRAAGYGGTVAATFANDRCGLAGNRRFIDRGDAFNDFAIARDDLTRFNDNHVAFAQ